MKVSILAVGKLKEKYFVDALAEYAKRIGAYCDFSVVELQAAIPTKTPMDQTIDEGKEILSKTKGYVIAMDRCGKNFSSEDLASLIKEKSINGNSEFTFIIGGSHGLSEEVLKKVDLTISFGRVTFPHQLFRIILAEQIYRAFTINAGAPYHK